MEEDDAVVGESVRYPIEVFDDLVIGVFAVDEDEGVFVESARAVKVLGTESGGDLDIEIEILCDASCEGCPLIRPHGCFGVDGVNG